MNVTTNGSGPFVTLALKIATGGVVTTIKPVWVFVPIANASLTTNVTE